MTMCQRQSNAMILLSKSFGSVRSFSVKTKTDENQRIRRLCDDRQMNRHNITGSVLIKAEMKGWISKRKDLSINRRTQSHVTVSRPSSDYVELLHLQTERQGKTSGKNRVEMGKGKEKSGGCSPMPGFRKT